MKKLYFFLAALGLLHKPAGAQISMNNLLSAQQIAQYIVGPGISISNVNLLAGQDKDLPSGSPQAQAGLFWFANNNSPFGLKEGIFLTTSNFPFIFGPNNERDAGGTGKFVTPSFKDSDLDKIAQGASLDAAILEFDFVPQGNKAEFRFVFASEEYPEFVGTSYNDVFGFFISGPGISPTRSASGSPLFSRNAKNIALIPGSSTPITVNTVNNGNANNGPCLNCAYYISNGDGLGGPQYTDPTTVQFDGFTQVLTARLDSLQCLKTYHIKLAIADIRDINFGSAVFIEAASLQSKGFSVGEINPVGPQCEGDTIQLQVSGSSTYNYLWNTGASGQSTTAIVSPQQNSFSVTVSNNEGCSLTRSIQVPVYVQQNQPPYCTGINGTGTFTYYVQAGRAFCIDLPHGDPQSNEKVTVSIPRPELRPPNSTFIFPNGDNSKSNTPLARFCWQPGTNDIGEHCFTDTVIDDNKCGRDTSIYQICIRVYCQGCDSSVYYQMRSQASGFPLPARTAAAQRIVAGNKVVQGLPQGKVIVSSGEQVHFKAGLEIVLDTGFIAEAGSEFTAEVHEATCTSEADCNFCCRYWTGWDDIHVPNVITPNGDGQNDYFTIGRWSAPGEMGCLPNLTCYELEIFNRWGLRVYQNSYNAANVPGLLNPYQCCYISNLLIPGWHNLNVINWGGNGHDDDFFYVLKLCSGCDGEKTFNGTLKVMGSNSLQAPLPGAEEPWQAEAPASLRIVPNPGNGIFELWTTGLAPTEKAELEICNAAGQPVYKQTSYHTGPLQINLGQAPKGIYYLKMNSGQRLFVKKIVIQ